MASRLAALDAVEASIEATELEEQQLMSWLGAVNNLRLVLGTMLDVSEELEIGVLPDDAPDIEAYALYAYLSSLLGEIVDALDPWLRLLAEQGRAPATVSTLSAGTEPANSPSPHRLAA